jgi:hypothetical protein
LARGYNDGYLSLPLRQLKEPHVGRPSAAKIPRQNRTCRSLRNRRPLCGAALGDLKPGGFEVSALEDVADRAINYTNSVLNKMPSYREPAIAGLRKLRGALAAQTPEDPAIAKLDAYLESLDRSPSPGESSLTRRERLL